MKNNKLLWIVTLIAWIFTIIVMGFLPDQIPMHYDMAGNIDRWGSKYENFLFPIIILVMTLIFHFSIRSCEKKLAKTILSKEKAELNQMIKIVRLVGVLMAVIFTVMHIGFTVSAFLEAKSNATASVMDINLVVNLLVGVMLVVLGVCIPRAKQNHFLGFRTKKTLADETVWKMANRFAGHALVVAGILIAIVGIVVGGMLSIILMIVIVLVASFVSAIYAATL